VTNWFVTMGPPLRSSTIDVSVGGVVSEAALIVMVVSSRSAGETTSELLEASSIVAVVGAQGALDIENGTTVIVDASTGQKPPPPGNQPGQVTEKKTVVNTSNNKSRPNESGGTEANQKVGNQARGGRPTVSKRVPTA
jgi:hypothetical protein